MTHNDLNGHETVPMIIHFLGVKFETRNISYDVWNLLQIQICSIHFFISTPPIEKNVYLLRRKICARFGLNFSILLLCQICQTKKNTEYVEYPLGKKHLQNTFISHIIQIITDEWHLGNFIIRLKLTLKQTFVNSFCKSNRQAQFITFYRHGENNRFVVCVYK